MNDQQKQNNLIIQIVVGVIALITCIVLYVNRPIAVAQADPPKVAVVNVKVPEGLVQKTAGLPSDSSNNQSGVPAASGSGAAGGPPRSGRSVSSAGG